MQIETKLKTVLLAASFAVIGAVSTNAALSFDAYQSDSLPRYQPVAPAQISAEARRAMARATVNATRQSAPFSRAANETFTW